MAKKRWSVLVYIVADHADHSPDGLPLDALAKAELEAILQAADTTQMHVAMQVDFNRGGPTRFDITPKRPRGLFNFRERDPRTHPLTRKFLDGGRLVDVKVEEGDETNAASPEVLAYFLKWGRQNFEADYYAIMFWGHSSGPKGLFFDTTPGTRTPTKIDPIELAAAVKATEPADVLLFRDCCMSTLEIAYQMQHVAKFAIATQAIDPIQRPWPYADLFGILQTIAPGNEAAVARALTVRLGTYYDDPKNRFGIVDVPYTLLDLRRLDGALTTPLKQLSTALNAARKDSAAAAAAGKALEQARRGSPVNPLNPGDPVLLDVPAICANLKISGIRELVDAANAVDAALPEVRLFHHAQKDRYKGVSVYYKAANERIFDRSFIDPVDVDLYKRLALSRSTDWNTVALDPLAIASAPTPRDVAKKK